MNTSPWQTGVLAAVLVLVGIASWALHLREPLAIDTASLADFPLEIGDWEGREIPMEGSVEEMLDADFNAYLLEGNGNPSMNENAQYSAGGNTDNLIASMVDAVTRVQSEDWPRTAPPERIGGWELVYNEAQEACEGAYDPCPLFERNGQQAVADAFRYRTRYVSTEPRSPTNVHTYAGNKCTDHGALDAATGVCKCDDGWGGKFCTVNKM